MVESRIVLTGARGILGAAFARILPADSLVCLNRSDIDLANPDATVRLIVRSAPTLVINCAADTDVEGAEAAPEHAFAVNDALAAAVAKAAAEAGAPMVHFSSTGCYGDWKESPYLESDPLRPTTVHHRSKAAGEESVLGAAPGALILRLGWIFGGQPGQRKNFVWSRLAEAAGKEEIGSNPYQTGCPTFADDVVNQSLALVRGGFSGIMNCVGGGMPTTRMDYVAAIVSAAGINTRVIPVVFPRRAPVSPNEAAVNARLTAIDLDLMPDWRLSLTRFIASMPAVSPAN